MRILKTLGVAVALAAVGLAVGAASASADLEEGPFHGTQIHGTFTGALNLACEGHFEGVVEDGSWPQPDLHITPVEFYDCDPPCAVNVATPVDAHADQSGAVTLEDVAVTIHCPGMGEIPFDGPAIQGQWDCQDEGELAFANQVFFVGGVPAATWDAEWHIEGLHLDGKECV